MTAILYDPLTYDNLMLGLAWHFGRQATRTMDSGDPYMEIEGPGIYALYYAGPFDPYRPVSIADRPIYVGKAVPPGSRRGEGVDSTVPALRRRLREHTRSIEAAANLEVADFAFRSLAVQPVWIALAERFLIDRHKPVWNVCLDGFGDHDPGRGRSGSRKSRWDTLHPGRPWADRLSGERSVAEAMELVRNFLAGTR